LWRALRRRQLGVAFRRQVPVAGQFIADFLAQVWLLLGDARRCTTLVLAPLALRASGALLRGLRSA
jgi:hypothetical protein